MEVLQVSRGMGDATRGSVLGIGGVTGIASGDAISLLSVLLGILMLDRKRRGGAGGSSGGGGTKLGLVSKESVSGMTNFFLRKGFISSYDSLWLCFCLLFD